MSAIDASTSVGPTTVSSSFDLAADNLSVADGLRVLHGRGMTSLSNTYMLPADSRERNRLSLQHRVWRLMHGGTGLYPSVLNNVVDRLLSPPKEGQLQPAVLDVGSGSGIWVTEMAELFPHARVLGFDLAESKPDHIPSNCRFVAGDAMNGLDEYANQFDVVHCRSVRGHVNSPQILLRGLCRALRPGGLILLGDGLYGTYDEHRNTLAPQPILSSIIPATLQSADESHSWFARWQAEMWQRLGVKRIPEKGEYVNLERNLRDTGGFVESSIKERVYYCPVGWPGHVEDDYEGNVGGELGKLMHANTLEWMRSSIVALLNSGVPQEVVDSWADNVIAELSSSSGTKVYMTWGIAWAIRK